MVVMSRLKSFFAEALVLVALCTCLSLAANALHARGIRLGRDYFPVRAASRQGPADEQRASAPPRANEQGPVGERHDGGRQGDPEAVEATRKSSLNHDLQVVSSEEAHEYFVKSEGSEGLIVFVDARNDEEYSGGHVPGALHVDHYQQEACLPLVRHLLEAAQVIIVYCQGGDCEDSIYLCNDLIYTHGFPYDNVYLYEGGIQEWRERGWPVNMGPQP